MSKKVNYLSVRTVGYILALLFAAVAPACADTGLPIIVAFPPFSFIPLIIVVIIEALILRAIARAPHPWKASALANLLSYLAGFILLFSPIGQGAFWYATPPLPDSTYIGASWIPGLLITFGLTYIIEFFYLKYRWRNDNLHPTRLSIALLCANIITYLPIAALAHSFYWSAVQAATYNLTR